MDGGVSQTYMQIFNGFGLYATIFWDVLFGKYDCSMMSILNKVNQKLDRSQLLNICSRIKWDQDLFSFPFRDTTLVFFIFGSPEGYNSHEVMFYQQYIVHQGVYRMVRVRYMHRMTSRRYDETRTTLLFSSYYKVFRYTNFSLVN